MGNRKDIQALLDGYLANTLSDEEVRAFLALVNTEEGFLQSTMDEWLRQESFSGLAENERGEMIYQQIMRKKEALENPFSGERAKLVVMTKRRWKHLLVAASVLTAILCGTWLMHGRYQNINTPVAVQPKVQDVAPGGNKAVLILANGKQIVLDSAQGNIVQQGNLKVINLNGKLDYEGQGSSVEYHTLSTPRGGQYKLVLPDGSTVWLNAASSITFPTAFAGKERSVTITGEVYFEIAHNEKQPFKVDVNGMEVKVLGTHFNINSYNDENDIKVTLLEGSVKVGSGSVNKVIKPGEQAAVENHGNPLIPKIRVQEVDTDGVMAWKNGLFNFDNTDIKEIMRQAARWYNIEVVYEGTISNEKYIGKVARNTNLSEMMKILELNGVKYRIEGRKIIITR